MKKVFVFMMATVVALGLASCSKMEDPAKPIEISDSDERSAVIEGTLLCVTDLKATPKKYEGAEGVEIVAVIPYAEILAPATPAGNWMKKITVDAAGHFTLNVPANPAGVNVTFKVSEKRLPATIIMVSGHSQYLPNQLFPDRDLSLSKK